MTLRVFHDGALVVGDAITIRGDEHHYLRRVRRARIGASVDVLDGFGTAVRAELTRLDDRSASLRIDAAHDATGDGPLELWLGIPDGPACLEAISGACELGCTRLVLVRCLHSAPTVPNAARIDRVIRAAMRQSGLPTPPAIEGPTALEAVLGAHDDPCGFFAWERIRGEATPIDADLPRRLLVGPEGGLTHDEAALCRAHGMQALSLGPFTLRTPTAVVAGLSRLRAT